MEEHALVYVGTYSEAIHFGTGAVLEGRGEGIHILRLDASSGELEPVSVARGVRNPSYLAFGPGGRRLYAVNELKSYRGEATGAVSSFAVDPGTGQLEQLDLQPTGGTDPCHVAVDRAGRWALVANYSSGSVCVLPIQDDGSLGAASDFVQFHGSGVNPARQAGPHAHAVAFDPSGRLLFVTDLGTDRLMIYRFDGAAGRLREHDPPWLSLEPGAGPRHFAFHPDGRHAFLVNELESTVQSFRFRPEPSGGGSPGRGPLEPIQKLSTLPSGFEGQSIAAALKIHPAGDHVYVSNRGHDSIAIYRIDRSTGAAALVGHEPSGGVTPRDIAVDPAGRFLLAANQDSGTIVCFRIDPDGGRLRPTGRVTKVGTPVCIAFPSVRPSGAGPG